MDMKINPKYNEKLIIMVTDNSWGYIRHRII